jgi:hypothetical protein
MGDVFLLPLSLAGSTVSVCVDPKGSRKRKHGTLIVFEFYDKPRLAISWKSKTICVNYRPTGGGRSEVTNYRPEGGGRSEVTNYRPEGGGRSEVTNYLSMSVNDFISKLGGDLKTAPATFQINWVEFPDIYSFTDQNRISLALHHMYARKGYDNIKKRQRKLLKQQNAIITKLDKLTITIEQIKAPKKNLGLSYDPAVVFPDLPPESFRMTHVENDEKFEDDAENYSELHALTHEVLPNSDFNEENFLSNIKSLDDIKRKRDKIHHKMAYYESELDYHNLWKQKLRALEKVRGKLPQESGI